MDNKNNIPLELKINLGEIRMYTIGVLSLIDLKENSHFKFLTEKGWATKEIMKKGVFNVDSKIRAIVIEESSMPKTCCQLIELKKVL